MPRLEMSKLLLRPFKIDDFDAVHAYAGSRENTAFMAFWGPNSEEQTRAFLAKAVAETQLESPTQSHLESQKQSQLGSPAQPQLESQAQSHLETQAQSPAASDSVYPFAVTLRSDGRLIGGCDLNVHGSQGEVGWILHRDYWRQGYGSELAAALLAYGFERLGLRRIIARCDAENIASYRIMEKNGMRREGLALAVRPDKNGGDTYGDELTYAILRDEWETAQEIEQLNRLPCVFSDFLSLPELDDGVIRLICLHRLEAIPEKKYVPAYVFAICRGSEKVGEINLRIGYTTGLYYSGQIGYTIDLPWRGNGYAVRACRLLAPVIRAHRMTTVLITNDQHNDASRRVCEKLGARLLRVARLPAWHDLYAAGGRFVRVFAWDVPEDGSIPSLPSPESRR